jgi:hypothetical protein
VSDAPSDGAYEVLRKQAIETALSYLRAQATRGYSVDRRRSNQAVVTRLRDSLLYRSDAAVWHSSALSRMQENALLRLKANFAKPNATGDIMRASAREQQFMFDDVVFNTIALFDYLGNTVGFYFYGDRRRKAKWDRIQRYARDAAFDQRDHEVSRVAGSEVGERVMAAHKAFVAPLSDYRADLIHYDTAPAGGGVQTKMDQNEAGSFDLSFELTITVPKPFARRFTVPGYETDPSKATLPEASSWLILESHRLAKGILRELERDMRGEGGGDPDGQDRVIFMS